jgi:hypothetical protein
MRITISLNEMATANAARTGETPDLGTLVRENSGAEVVKVYGRGRFVSIETNSADLHRLESALGHMCVFAAPAMITPFETQGKRFRG